MAKKKIRRAKAKSSFMSFDERDLRELAPTKAKGPQKDRSFAQVVTTPGARPSGTASGSR